MSRDFTDVDGRAWTASIGDDSGLDYKGRYYLVFHPGDDRGSDGRELALTDVRWNTERTARRTIETMSIVELRRRLRSAKGRYASAHSH
jgi:hypothetical protein